MNRLLSILFCVLVSSQAWAQSAVLQGGTWTGGHLAQYGNNTGSQPVIIDSGGAGGGNSGVNPSELGITVRNPANVYPAANVGNGPNYGNFCIYDAPISNSTGYHYLCFAVNSGGAGLIEYGANGGAAQQPLQLNLNGATTSLQTTQGYTIGTLPTCNAAEEGVRLYVTNGQTSPSFMGTVFTTGAVVAPVFCNGSGWVYG